MIKTLGSQCRGHGFDPQLVSFHKPHGMAKKKFFFYFFASKGTIKKGQTTHRMKEMIANHISDISPISRIFKEFLQLNNKKSVKQ